MRMARLHIKSARKPALVPPDKALVYDTDYGLRLVFGGELFIMGGTLDEAEAEINAALRDIEGAEQRTRLDELLSDCLRKEAADDTA